MGNIECILAAGNNLSDSDLKILVNKIMDRLNHEKSFASSVKIVPRMECPVCHTSSHVVRNGHKHGKQTFLCRACGKSFITRSNTLLFNMTAVRSGGPSLLTRLWAYPLMTQEMDLIFSISGTAIPASSL